MGLARAEVILGALEEGEMMSHDWILFSGEKSLFTEPGLLRAKVAYRSAGRIREEDGVVWLHPVFETFGIFANIKR